MEEVVPEEDNLRYLRAAQEAMNGEQYDEVIRSASQVASRSKYHDNARHMQSGAYFHRGIAAVQQERFSQAAADLEQALSLNDDAEERRIITEQLDIVREGPNVQHIQAAQEAVQSEHYDQAIQSASKVARGSTYFSHARRLQATAYFNRGINNAKQEQFDRAEVDLERAIELDDDKEEQNIIKRQLSAVYNAHAVHLVQPREMDFSRSNTFMVGPHEVSYPSYDAKRQAQGLLEKAVNSILTMRPPNKTSEL